MTRQSKKIVSNVTREMAEESFARYNTCISKLEVQQGKMNAELTAVKEKYESTINKLQEEKEECFVNMQTYAEENANLFMDKKSMDFTHGTIGFRTGMPKLSCRKGFKWPAVFELVKEKMKKYIRIKEEVDKESLLADRTAIDLKAIGLEVTQDETFYVTPNLEVVATS